jgi:radical SAM superfamily enzyme YgiQ (UPF0313 family)
MAMQATYHRDKGNDVDWNPSKDKILERAYMGEAYEKVVTEPEFIDFLKLPIPDRLWTDAFNPKYQKYGNYKYHPATHMQAADGCWHGQCTFCVENGRGYACRTVDSVLSEIEECKRLGFKEIFDDSGTFPQGKWLIEFCQEKFLHYKDIVFGCNMRIGANVDFSFMKSAGFRMVLFGIESANQKTLDRLNKGVNADDIIPTIKNAAEAGLEPHIAVMFGIDGETEEEERKTLDLVHYLLRKGYAKTAQASVYDVPSRDKFDSNNARRIYNVARYPDFWIKQLSDIHNLDDFLYFTKKIKKGITRD